MHARIQKSLHEDVLPWLFSRVDEFLVDDAQVVQNSYQAIERGIRNSQFEHGKKIDQINQKRVELQKEHKKFLAAEAKRRADRRLAREKREKDNAKEAFKAQVIRQVVDKGSVTKNMDHVEVHELEQCQDAKVLSAYGGHFQQIYFTVAAAMEVCDSDLSAYYKRKQEAPAEVIKASTPAELMLETYFIPFLVGYLQHMKAEGLSIVATPEALELLESFKIGLAPQGFFELAKMTKEQYLRFRNLFCEQRLNKPQWLANRNHEAMELCLRAFCMIICKKLPAEISHPPNLHTRVRLVPPKTSDKPCKAVLCLSFPLKKNDAPVKEPAEGAEPRPDMVEIEQDDKVLSVNAHQAALDYSLVVVNRAAARQAREDFLDAIKKSVPETFLADQGKSQKAILALASQLNQDREEQYFMENCSEYEKPLFDVPINAHAFD